jgi:hypothetical protein
MKQVVQPEDGDSWGSEGWNQGTRGEPGCYNVLAMGYMSASSDYSGPEAVHHVVGPVDEMMMMIARNTVHTCNTAALSATPVWHPMHPGWTGIALDAIRAGANKTGPCRGRLKMERQGSWNEEEVRAAPSRQWHARAHIIFPHLPRSHSHFPQPSQRWTSKRRACQSCFSVATNVTRAVLARTSGRFLGGFLDRTTFCCCYCCCRMPTCHFGGGSCSVIVLLPSHACA